METKTHGANDCVYGRGAGAVRQASLHHDPPTHDSPVLHRLAPPNQTTLSNIITPMKIQLGCPQRRMDVDQWNPNVEDYASDSGLFMGPACRLCVPDGQQLVQQICSSGQQSPSGQVERLPPPRVRAQNWHDPAVVLQWVGDDVAIKRDVPIRAQQPGGEALVLAQVNHTRPRPSKPDAPVHALGVRLSASLWHLGASSARASWMLRREGAGRLAGEHPRRRRPLARCSSPQRGRHPPLTARLLLDAGRESVVSRYKGNADK